MDGKNSSHRWIWHDDGYGLDNESPLAISHGLWEDLTHSDAGVKTLFSSTPESEIREIRPPLISSEKENAEATSSGQHMSEDSPRFKRRRMLQYPGEQGNLESCHSDVEPSSEPLESCSESHIGSYRDFQLQYEPDATTSLWHVANEESMSSVEDVVEQSAESWMARCFRDTEADVSQNLTASWMTRCFDASETQAWQNHMNVEWQCTGTEDFRTICSVTSGGNAVHLPSAVVLPDPAASGRTRALGEATAASRPRRVATPVAYPFAVVKPSGMQGDVTLDDINERIMMRKSRQVPELSSPLAAGRGVANLSGKSVVALTKIHTEGNGTITIVRTKN